MDGNEEANNEKYPLSSAKLLIAPELHTVREECFANSLLEKLIGNKLQRIEFEAFNSSHLRQINLKNVL